MMDHNAPRHYGNMRGEVVRVDDPLKAGRVKVNVFGVYDDIPEQNIPWAIYADPMMGGIANVGSVVVPEIGAHVWVFFEGGDHHYPVYWAGAPAMKDGTPDLPEESRSEESVYPSNKVRKTKSGILMEMDDTEGNIRLRFYHPSGTENLIDNDGNIVATAVGNETNNVDGDVTETIGGNSTKTISGDEAHNVSGGQTEDIDGDKTSTAGGSFTQSATEVTINSDGNITITAGGNVDITGAIINLN